MPERITLTNYNRHSVAHVQMPVIKPGKTVSRDARPVDTDADFLMLQRMALIGVLVKFDDVTVPTALEVDAAVTVTPEQNLVVASEAGFTVTLPKLADVDAGHPVTIVRKAGATGTLTIDADGSETIKGLANATLTEDNQSLRIRKASATNWA